MELVGCSGSIKQQNCMAKISFINVIVRCLRITDTRATEIMKEQVQQMAGILDMSLSAEEEKELRNVVVFVSGYELFYQAIKIG